VFASPEAEFLNVIGTIVLRVFFLAIHSHLPLLNNSGLKQVFNVNIVYGNLKSDNSQDFAQPQRNSPFMNSASARGDAA
jgi:hypothetical protein